MSNKITYIYTLSHPLTGEVRYVGKSNDLKKRLKEHGSAKANTKKDNWLKSLKKNGLRPTIDIVESVSSEEWKYWEVFYISLFKSWGFNLTNGTRGGEGALGAKRSYLTKQKISDSLKNTYSDPVRRKLISDRLTGRKLSDETKKKLSSLNSGELHRDFGKHLSAQTRIKIGIAHKGKILSDETKGLLSKINKDRVTEAQRTKFIEMVKSHPSKGFLGMSHTEEGKKKISEASKAMWAKRRMACQIA